ncbi:hypothetical protein SUGI_0863480 [Cryptomeria japonica]|nr:hypothetical protein SUGI_0863480 [Cryptomeria japonica]
MYCFGLDVVFGYRWYWKSTLSRTMNQAIVMSYHGSSVNSSSTTRVVEAAITPIYFALGGMRRWMKKNANDSDNTTLPKITVLTPANVETIYSS